MILRYLRETRGRTTATTAKILCNKLAYALVHAVGKPPNGGWLHSEKHWYAFPFSLRSEVLWSPSLKAWFRPEDESAIEGMLHLGNYEPVEWVAPRPGDVVLDVGAYVGWYTIQAARAVGPAGRVVALEPDVTNRRQLEQNLSLNGIRNCTVLPLAAWSRSARVAWYAGEEPVWHKVDEANGAETVEAVTLDELVARLALHRLDWIKLDVEGAEIEILKGACNALQQFRPQLFVEVHETFAKLRRLPEMQNYLLERVTFDQLPEKHGWVLARPVSCEGRELGIPRAQTTGPDASK